MEFTKVPNSVETNIQINGGIIVDSFTPSTGVIGNIVGAASSDGITFNSNPTYVDDGEDILNMPANTMQMKRVSYFDPTLSGTFKTVTAALAKKLLAAGVIDSLDSTHIVPAHKLTAADFEDIWLVGDYSDKNTGAAKAGYVAVHLMNALNTLGFQWSTVNNGKGNFPFEFHGHYDYDDVDEAPFEIYVKVGTT